MSRQTHHVDQVISLAEAIQDLKTAVCLSEQRVKAKAFRKSVQRKTLFLFALTLTGILTSPTMRGSSSRYVLCAAFYPDLP